MAIERRLPSYEELFAQLDFKKGEAARSVYSPAAYLTDLVQMIEDHFSASMAEVEGESQRYVPDIRRADIKDLILNGDNTFTEIPYLDIVNDLLRQRLEARRPRRDALTRLKQEVYPLNMPLNFDYERLKLLLSLLNVREDELEDLFRETIDNDERARRFLGLSPEESRYIFRPRRRQAAGVRQAYQMQPDQAFSGDPGAQPAPLTQIDHFLAATGLSGSEVRELLQQNLSAGAYNAEGDSERVLAARFFINHDLGGFARLDADETSIVWQSVDESDEDGEGRWVIWFDRVDRLVRLAQKSGFSLTDVDLVLRDCAHNRLDGTALQRLALVKQLTTRWDQPVAVICALFRDVSSAGIGEDKEPADLFNRTFNGRFAFLDQQFIPQSAFVPEGYRRQIGNEPANHLLSSEDILADTGSSFRGRLQRALRISQRELSLMVTRFRERAELDTSYASTVAGQLSGAGLSLIFRVTQLTELLDISVQELLDLLDLLELDPLVRQTSHLDSLLPGSTTAVNCYRILENRSEDDQDIFWLIQTLATLVEWLHTTDFSTADLKFVQTGTYANEKEAVNAAGQRIAMLHQLLQAFAAHGLSATSFSNDPFDTRASRVIYESLVQDPTRIVSPVDNRIVRFAEARAERAAGSALNRLSVVTQEDFQGIGISGRLTEKLLSILVGRGHVTADGVIVPENVPDDPEQFALVTDFSERREDIFDLLYEIYAAEQDELLAARTGQDIPDTLDLDLSFYLSDLQPLGLSASETVELYDNLIFNGYVDEEGNVAEPGLFADYDNEAEFEVNTALTSQHTRLVYDVLRQRLTAFTAEAYVLNPAIFADLPLSEPDVQELVENLQFNGYIDADGAYVDKGQFWSLARKKFKMALRFYPYQQEILDAIVADLETVKARHYKLDTEGLMPVAEAIASDICFGQLSAHVLVDDRISPAWRSYFADNESRAGFALGRPFAESDNAAVFDRLQLIQQQSDRYRLSDEALLAIDLDTADIAAVKRLLQDQGLLTAEQTVPPAGLAYFLNLNNALTFRLTGYDDFNKDVFFAIHGVATAGQHALQTIVDKLRSLAESQENAVIDSLAEGFELEPASLRLLCGHLLYDPANVVEALLLPVIEAATAVGTVTALPAQFHFNRMLQRLAQFARLATLLQLTPAEVAVVCQDQNLVEKFPENIVLPEGMTQFDALLPGLDGKIYLFQNDRVWVYGASTYELEEAGLPLTTLSPLFAEIERVDAAFITPAGDAWLTAGTQYFVRPQGATTWETRERRWGKVHNNLSETGLIQAGYTDGAGATYLFSGDQYVRYSGGNVESVDPGFPRQILPSWREELGLDTLPDRFADTVDAAFESQDGETFLFKDGRFVRMESGEIVAEGEIAAHWGQVDNNFAQLNRLDAAYGDDDGIYLFLDDQVIFYADQIENRDVRLAEGFPRRLSSFIAGLPDEFEYGFDAVFKGEDGQLHIFKNSRCLTVSSDTMTVASSDDLTNRWGRVRNNFVANGVVDAAFTGLDGCTYLFSGDQYVRYSGKGYARVDEGFPRTIAGDWGGLEAVNAAFILDGKTYLFAKGEATYIRYSTNDYSAPDEGYPKAIDQEAWWNLPQSLVEAGFDEPDAVYVGPDENRYLFKGGQFVAFDHLHRWWSEPQALAAQWNGLEFDAVAAAFTGRDGKTYLFSDHQYVRFSDAAYSQIDDRYPRQIGAYWGRVVNNIERSRRVDSAVVVTSHEMALNEEGVEQTTEARHTYLFSGNQYVRYAGDAYDFVEEGYPRTIQGSLHEEPRFGNLPAPWQRGLDAAFADRRHVYLVQGTTVHIIAENSYQRYDETADGGVGTAVIDEGSLYLSSEDGWHRHNSPEALVGRSLPDLPPLLRDVPESYQRGLSAILQGTDENTYLFRGANCYDLSLKKAYPAGEAWGRVHNRIDEDNRVDAAFVGVAGRTYLFSGDQFVSYEPNTAVNMLTQRPTIDGLPRLIADHWGGLTHVHLAYVQAGITYLCEKPDEFDEFLVVRYSTADYSQPDEGFPRRETFDRWQIPYAYQDDGFERVDAVLTDDTNLFLLQGDSFIQYNSEQDIWTYARPVSQVWRGLGPESDTRFAEIATAFQGSDGQVHFFADGHFTAVTHDIDNPAPAGTANPVRPIDAHWGVVDNRFDSTDVVDAAFVWDGRETYLFSGDQYVKYSGADYRTVDAGYPKRIGESLREEALFQQLPDSFAAELAANGNALSAAVANKGSVYLFVGESLHIVSPSAARTCQLARLGHMTNRIQENNKVDAAVVSEEEGQRQLLLFAGDQLFVYSTHAYDFVDEGSPRRISSALRAEIGLTAGDSFTYDVDAVLQVTDGPLFLFKGDEFVGSDDPGVRKQVRDVWGKVKNNFVPTGETINVALDGVLVARDGATYLFSGDQFVRHSDFDDDFADEGYPLPLTDNWGNLPQRFEAAIDGAFMFEGKSYLLKDGASAADSEYVRYSRPHYRVVDNIYPQKIRQRWLRQGDYLLADIQLMTTFKMKQEESRDADVELVAFLNGQAGDKATPYEHLHDMFGWRVAESKWIKRHNAFLPHPTRYENRFDLETVEKMNRIFGVSERLGVAPSALYSEVWQPLYEPGVEPAYDTVADTLYRYLASQNSEQDWAIIERQVHDALNLVKRDAWVPLLIALEAGLTQPKDLYDLLLIDVEMGSEAKTSRVKEAISALQLFFHRYLLSLEPTGLSPEDDAERRAQLKARWPWLKNYRLWEANRKVFLYPENYIRPELRDTKTPEFGQLEETLLQGELNMETAEAAFTSYLESFSGVSNLKIAGANVIEDRGEKLLILFGHSRLEPKQYYYRTARFGQPEGEQREAVIWSAWDKVDVTINSGRVFPIQSNGRLMVFWIEIEDIEEPAARFKSKTGDEIISEVTVAQEKLRHEAHIKFSVLKYNKHWTSPQPVRRGLKLDYEIDAAFSDGDQILTFAGEFCLRTSDQKPNGEVKRIREVDEFSNLPSYFHAGIDAATIFKGQRYLFKRGHCVVQDRRSGDYNLYSLRDLIPPVTTPTFVVAGGVFGVSYVSYQVTQTEDPIINKGVDAAFALNDHVLVLVDTEGTYSFYTESEGRLHPIRDLAAMLFWVPFFFVYIATLVTRSGQFRPADAVFKKDGIFYVLRDGQYECYDDVGTELVPLDGFPKPIRGNLSFNMDQFFNRLHLEYDRGSIFLSYASPKSRLLLYGRLKPDFTFVEIPYQHDRALTLLLSWNSFLQTHLPNYYGYLGPQIGAETPRIRGRVTSLNNTVTTAAAIEVSNGELDEALAAAEFFTEIQEFEEGEEEEAAAARTQQKAQIDALLAALTERLEPMSNRRPLRPLVRSLLDYAPRLTAAVNTVFNADDETWNQAATELRQAIQEGRAVLADTTPRLTAAVRQIHRDVQVRMREVGSLVQSSVRPDVDFHRTTAVRFEQFLGAILDHIQVWRERIFEDNDDIYAAMGAMISEVEQARGSVLGPYREHNEAMLLRAEEAVTESENLQNPAALTLNQISTHLRAVNTRLTQLGNQTRFRGQSFESVDQTRTGLLNRLVPLVADVREAMLGRFDLFPPEFGIDNKWNFAFSEPGRPDWYCFEAKEGTFLCRPLSDVTRGRLPQYEIFRLTTAVVPRLSAILFAQGIPGLLSLETQKEDEAPAFGSGPDEIAFRRRYIKTFVQSDAPGEEEQERVPVISRYLDFRGANGLYYEELFFHAPFLIAQALNAAQKFEEARRWYEFIFDPTEVGIPWQYLPFIEAHLTGDGGDQSHLFDESQIRRYLDDPFDPHAIAALRPSAYRKAIVMSYIDNLLDWGDRLFRRYTIESINEARMLYIFAYDLLGDKPENLGNLLLSPEKPVSELANTAEYDFVVTPLGGGGRVGLIDDEPIRIIEGTPHDSVAQHYFHVPQNGLFNDYWNRVEDRLYKIRQSLNIDGQKQPLLLFQPPIDPMAIVRAVAAGVSLSQLLAGTAVKVPHYRFEFLVYRAQNLVQKLNQFGGELLATLEKRDAEALSRLQTRQEGEILGLNIRVREAQIEEAGQTILSLEASREHAQERIQLYAGWLESGMLPEEIHQINLMIAASVAHFAGSGLKIASGIASLIPDINIGPFIMGTTTGGSNIGDSLGSGAEVLESLGEGLSVTGEALGMQAQFKHMVEDWEVQLMAAESENRQLMYQIEGARLQQQIAEYELAVLHKEIEQNEAVQAFYKEKFTNQELYQWLIGRMSGLFYQTYQLALDVAKMAERAFQFERGLEEKDVSYINGFYWESQRRGLLAGERLALDLDQMEQAFIESAENRLEITKEVSLLELDPLAFLNFKRSGVCEFNLSETFYDYDFPGHYRRQIKTMAVGFDVPEGATVNATLTQLSHQTVLKEDDKAVKYLIEPRDEQPTTIRTNWKGNQQIILSHHDEYEKNNGLFELRFDNDHYLPFEGTGAVSRWRLELNGKKGAFDLNDLLDIRVNIKYTARQGGGVFAEAVKGMLKPYRTVRFFDMTYDFADVWNDFLDGDSDVLLLPLTRELFPNMGSSKIAGIFTRFDLVETGRATMMINDVEDWVLANNRYLETNGLSISRRGSELRLEFSGNRANLRNLQLVFSYKATVG